MVNKALADRSDPGADIAAAEYLASREMATVGGLWFEFADEVSRIAQQQTQWWLEDMQSSMEKLAQAQAPSEVLLDHMRRRVDHNMQALSEVGALWNKEVERSLKVHRRMWAPYLDMLSDPR